MKLRQSILAAVTIFALAASTTPGFSKSCGSACVKHLEGEIADLQKKIDALNSTLSHTQIRESDNHNICMAHNSPGPGYGTKDCANGSDEYFVIGPK